MRALRPALAVPPAVWALAVAGLALAGVPPAHADPPSVLLVVLDSVRADRLSAYGYERPTSPQLADLAQRGVLFRDVTAPGNWAWPSLGTIFTGVPPWVHGAGFNGSGGEHTGKAPLSTLRGDLQTLAERFLRAGYRTAFLTSNRRVAPTIAGNLVRGFEKATYPKKEDADIPWRLRNFLESPDPRPAFVVVNTLGAHGPYLPDARHPWVAERSTLLARGTAPRWIRPFLTTRGGGITFYHEIRPGRETWAREIVDGPEALPEPLIPVLRAVYDSEVARADALLGEMLADWQRHNEDSIVAVTSDNGEYLGERGLVDHAVLLYPEVLHVPLVISAPGQLPEGAVIDTPIELQDLHPTLLELALGVEEEGSLLPVVSGGAGRPLVRAEARPRGDARSERMKRHHRLCRWGDAAVIVSDGGTAEHYDVGEDPRMQRDLAGERPERTAELAQRCRDSFGDAVAARSRPEPGSAPGGSQR